MVSPFDANGKVRLNTAHPYLSGGISSSIVLVAAITLKKRIRESFLFYKTLATFIW